MGFFSTTDLTDKNKFLFALLHLFVRGCFMKTEIILVGSSESHLP